MVIEIRSLPAGAMMTSPLPPSKLALLYEYKLSNGLLRSSSIMLLEIKIDLVSSPDAATCFIPALTMNVNEAAKMHIIKEAIITSTSVNPLLNPDPAFGGNNDIPGR